MRRPLALLTCLALATVAKAADEPRQPFVMFGTCELARDPETAAGAPDLAFNACVRGKVGSEITFVSGTPEENSWLRYADLDGGIFVTPWLSFQGRGKYRQILPMGKDAVASRDLYTDYATVTVGNPVLHHTRLTAGRLRLPFGLDQTEATQYYQSAENRAFWASPEQGGYVTLDDMRNLRLDIGYSSTEIREKNQPDQEAVSVASGNLKDPIVRATAARLMVDFSPLDGSRLVFSGYGENHGVRRMGIGFVTVSRKSDMTEFEFVRRLATPSGSDAPFEQLLRVGYVGAFRGDTRWVVQFDDERFRFRRGMLGHDIEMWKHFDFRLGVTYQKSESGDGDRRWYVTSGLEAKL